jgi:hypothetical protein
MEFTVVIIIIIIFILVLYIITQNCTNDKNSNETFNVQNGTLCQSCENKTFNDCLGCFNCGYCIDQWGNGKCIGGDAASGPYNKEKCKLWYQGDQSVRMKQNNANYKCEYGPPNQNRIIGVNPPGQLNAAASYDIGES